MVEQLEKKRVVSVSLGSSTRDGQASLVLGSTLLSIERRGTDGDKAKAAALLAELDGQVAALGLGGTDLYVYAGGRRYTFREAARLVAGVRHTPVLDGSGLKASLERRLVASLQQRGLVELAGKKALLVCAVDRFGLGEALVEAGVKLTCGDLVFGLGLPLPLHSLTALGRWARLLAPVVTWLPLSWFYPTGGAQERHQAGYEAYFQGQDLIAGDFHYIKKFMPPQLPGVTVLTNTVTPADRALLRQAGVRLLVTSTPNLGGRSFGTNVLEACLVASQGARGPLSQAEYLELLQRYKIEASVEYLQEAEGAATF